MFIAMSIAKANLYMSIAHAIAESETLHSVCALSCFEQCRLDASNDRRGSSATVARRRAGAWTPRASVTRRWGGSSAPGRRCGVRAVVQVAAVVAHQHIISSSRGAGHRPGAGLATQELLRRDHVQRRPAAKVGGVPGDERRRSRPAALRGGEHQRVPELHSPSQASGDVVCLEVDASRLRPHPHPVELAEATSEPRRLLHGGMQRHRASDLEHGDDGCHPLPRTCRTGSAFFVATRLSKSVNRVPTCVRAGTGTRRPARASNGPRWYRYFTGLAPPCRARPRTAT